MSVFSGASVWGWVVSSAQAMPESNKLTLKSQNLDTKTSDVLILLSE